MIIIIAEEGKKIHLGRVGENEARAVRFDVSRILAEFPGATFSVLNMRPEDPDAYPVNGQYIRIEGNYLYWTLQSGDLTQDALGECELKATLDGVIVKSIIWTTEICPALDGNGTPPEPWESWVEQVEEAAEDSEAWAVGERGGVPVADGDPTYENNAKYYAEEAAETLASKADKTDTVLNTTLSRGRKSTTAKGTASIAFGTDVTASGANSTAVGSNTKATGSYSSASGLATEATGSSSHAEGNNTRADGQGSHAEGYNTSASGQYSHSENEYTTARGAYSHAEGSHTTASHKSQHVFGEYNEEDNPSGSASSRGAFIEIVGNGTAYNAKSNARTLDWDGNERLKGKLFVNANADGTGGDEVLTEHQDMSGKADKVQDAVSGNFAGLDAEGNLTDSGKAASDFVAAENFRADAMPMSETDPTTVAEKATELKSAIDQKASIIRDTVQNVAIASVPDAASNLPLTALKFRVEPIQAGSGDPSPQNQRSITGRSSAVVGVAGVNLFDKTISCTEGKIRGNDGTETASASSMYTAPIGGFEPSTKYTLQGTLRTSVSQFRVYFLDRNQNWISRTSAQSDVPYTFTTPANCYYIEIQCSRSYSDFNTVMVEKGSTASPYTAYTGITHTVQFGSTVYGGQIDWVNGVMVVDHALDTMTGNDVVSVGTASSGINYARMSELSSRGVTTTATNKDQLKSNLYVASKDATVNNSIRINANTTPYAYNNDLDTLEKAQTFYNANPLQIWYPLYTPIEITLSNLDEIRTVLGGGTMNLWADCGDVVEMTYPCDTKGYIDKKLAEIQALILENS